jgi:hypothetical protein
MDSKSYLTLNSWLQKADSNYISGRLLWLNNLIDGASNLLWLSCEQMVKILLLQRETDNISSECSDLDEMHANCDKKGRNFGHSVNNLSKQLVKEYSCINLTRYKPVLEKLHEYFFRRYAAREGSSIPLDLLNLVDEFYFELRSKVQSDVGLGTIDEIYIQKKIVGDILCQLLHMLIYKIDHFAPESIER